MDVLFQSRREFFAALNAAAFPLAQAAPARRPIIVVILADDLGYGELSGQGNPQIPTPHIDSIAANGVRFTNGYVSAPICAPSRAGLMTGRYQTRFGHERNVAGERNRDPKVGLPHAEETLASLLKSTGYATGGFGKWHPGAADWAPPSLPRFDIYGNPVTNGAPLGRYVSYLVYKGDATQAVKLLQRK